MTTDITPADSRGDDRIACADCRSLAGAVCRRFRVSVLEALPRRCIEFAPKPGSTDMRTGAQRWPNLEKQTELARKEDAQAALAMRGH